MSTGEQSMQCLIQYLKVTELIGRIWYHKVLFYFTFPLEQCFPTFFVLCTPWAYLSYHEYPHVDDSQKV